MSDVLIVCPKCSNECKISELAAADGITCPSCGGPLSAPKTRQKMSSKLSLKANDDAAPPPTYETNEEAPEIVVSEFQSAMKLTQDADRLVEEQEQPESEVESGNVVMPSPDAMTTTHRQRETVKNPRVIWGWLFFLGIAGGLLFFQYKMDEYPAFREYHFWGRAALWALTAIIIYVAGFEDTVFQGFFCLLCPPYAVYYVIVRSDSYVLRGMLMALLVALFAELYFMKDAAFLITMQDWMNSVITGGENLIIRASDAPVF